MLLIVAHHYIVNSGMREAIVASNFNMTYYALLMFGAWGKTGINCFVLITGYFMCRSSISLRKLLRLYLQITLYSVVIYAIFCITGHEQLSPSAIAWRLFPMYNISHVFPSCFLVFYLLIPFINILLNGLDRKRHLILTLILIFIYTILPSINSAVEFNYVTWFFVLYLISSYIRFYGFGFDLKPRVWGCITIMLILLASISVLVMYKYYLISPVGPRNPYWFIEDSNKLFALAIGISSFMWFKGLKIPYSRAINTIGATTFGVLLIHANSNAMRHWLWRETIDVVGHSGGSLLFTLGYATISVILIFAICSCIEWLRGKFIEPLILDKFADWAYSLNFRLLQLTQQKTKKKA